MPRRHIMVPSLGAIALVTLACGQAPSASPGDEMRAAGRAVDLPGLGSGGKGGGSGSGGRPATGGAGGTGSNANSACKAPEGLGSPGTINQVIALLNSMPLPVTLPCFLQSLDRPLRLNGTEGFFSAQPAQGERSPRIFIAVGNLAMSVVPEGFGRDFLEMGEFTSNQRSVKAELHFPITARLEAKDAFASLEFPGANVTSCGVCHASEVSVVGPAFARESQALRPHPLDDVPVETLAALAAECDDAKEPERCGILQALFAGGEPLQYRFPLEMQTFY